LEENKNARKARATPAFAFDSDATVGIDRSASECVPEHLACEGAEEFLAAACEVSEDRGAAGFDAVVGLSAPLEAEEFETMPCPNMDAMLWFANRWWWFPGRQISVESQFEWKNGRAYLLEPDGSAVEGILFVGEVATE
jgi:hypothetical protein